MAREEKVAVKRLTMELPYELVDLVEEVRVAHGYKTSIQAYRECIRHGARDLLAIHNMLNDLGEKYDRR